MFLSLGLMYFSVQVLGSNYYTDITFYILLILFINSNKIIDIFVLKKQSDNILKVSGLIFILIMIMILHAEQLENIISGDLGRLLSDKELVSNLFNGFWIMILMDSITSIILNDHEKKLQKGEKK